MLNLKKQGVVLISFMPLILCNNLTPGAKVDPRPPCGSRSKTFVLELGFDHRRLDCEDRLGALPLLHASKGPYFGVICWRGTWVSGIFGKKFLDLMFHDFYQ